MGEGHERQIRRRQSRWTRRQLLSSGVRTASATLIAPGFALTSAKAFAALKAKHLAVVNIQRTTVLLPFRDAPRRAMDRELPHWRYVEVFEVKLASGMIGVGETLLYYTWGVSNDDDVRRVLGKNAADVMWDDSLGAGLQMALFDAVAQTCEVPLHRLLGRQQHATTPLSWWNIDMSPKDMASECAEALSQGYTSYKTKGRPWFDLWHQVDAVTQAVPESFKLDIDFNDTLRDADRAIPILKRLEKNPRIDIYESPIPQNDIEGNRRLREATRVAIAMHYGSPPPAMAICQGVCDGFVIGGGASRVLEQAAFSAEAGLPFWLQLVGTGITAAYSMHFGAVCSHATWPAVNCHQLYKDDLLKQPIVVNDGRAKIPETPGLGHALNRDSLERFRVEKPARRPEPPRLLETSWPDGKRLFIASNGNVNFMLTAGNREIIPFYKDGAMTRLVPNDGSDAWKRRYERARNEPFFE